MPLEKFELPRKDWYDKDGRIYKDVLIENFNAIEKKLRELNQLTPYEVELPDFSKIEYEDTTINSPDNKVVNLKSFINILGLIYVPLTCSFTGKKCNILSFYDDKYIKHEIKDKEFTELNEETNKFILLSKTVNDLFVADNIDNLTDNILIGIFDKGKVYNVSSLELADINVLTALCNMSEDIGHWYIKSDTSIRNLVQNGRAYGAANAESKGWALDLNLTDKGRVV